MAGRPETFPLKHPPASTSSERDHGSSTSPLVRRTNLGGRPSTKMLTAYSRPAGPNPEAVHTRRTAIPQGAPGTGPMGEMESGLGNSGARRLDLPMKTRSSITSICSSRSVQHSVTSELAADSTHCRSKSAVSKRCLSRSAFARHRACISCAPRLRQRPSKSKPLQVE
jgi:hypothetical protein